MTDNRFHFRLGTVHNTKWHWQKLQYMNIISTNNINNPKKINQPAHICSFVSFRFILPTLFH